MFYMMRTGKFHIKYNDVENSCNLHLTPAVVTHKQHTPATYSNVPETSRFSHSLKYILTKDIAPSKEKKKEHQ